MIGIASGTPDADRPMVLAENLFAQGSLYIWPGTAPGTAPENLLGPQTYDFWQPSAATSTFNVTLPAPAEANACAIVAHTLGSSGATVYVERSTNGGASWPLVASHVPVDDSPILMLWPAVSAAQWRIRLTGPAAPVLGVLMLGRRLVFPGWVRPGYVPVYHAARIELTPDVSLGGQYVGATIARRAAELSAGLTPLPGAWSDGALLPFARHFNEGRPFVWAASPARYPADCAYCWRRGAELRPAYGVGGQLVELTLEMAAHA